ILAIITVVSVVGVVIWGLNQTPLVAGLKDAFIPESTNQPPPSQTEAIDANTLNGQAGLHYLQSQNLVGLIDPKLFSAYDSLVQQGKIDTDATIITDKNLPQPTPAPASPTNNLNQGQLDD